MSVAQTEQAARCEVCGEIATEYTVSRYIGRKLTEDHRYCEAHLKEKYPEFWRIIFGKKQ
jgi:hypothetical protein